MKKERYPSLKLNPSTIKKFFAAFRVVEIMVSAGRLFHRFKILRRLSRNRFARDPPCVCLVLKSHHLSYAYLTKIKLKTAISLFSEKALKPPHEPHWNLKARDWMKSHSIYIWISPKSLKLPHMAPTCYQLSLLYLNPAFNANMYCVDLCKI